MRDYFEDKSFQEVFTEKLSQCLAFVNKMKRSLIILGLLLVVWGANSLMNSVTREERLQGYQPDQPIAFSHALHAGQMEIPCQYCHLSARGSKQAHFPTANDCMNCHMAVQGDKEKKSRSEIGKIYASAGWNPNAGEGGAYIPYPETMSSRDLYLMYRKYVIQDYTMTELEDEAIRREIHNDVMDIVAMFNTPIPWKRVNNLPDYVYFNHALHADVDHLECQSCHGPVQDMEVVYQWVPLSMKWCIDCHQNSEIDRVNPYYEETFQNLSGGVSGETMDLWKLGKNLFVSNCASCHHPENDGTGPALSGVRQRWIEDGDFEGKSGEEWLYAWIKNNKKVLESGHPYANALFKKWGGANMNLFAGLADEEIEALLFYVNNSNPHY